MGFLQVLKFYLFPGTIIWLLWSAFYGELGHRGISASNNCRSSSRDLAGTFAGNWFYAGVSTGTNGGRLTFTTEIGGEARITIDPFDFLFSAIITTSGYVSSDPELAIGTIAYCYTNGINEVWMQLQKNGYLMDFTIIRGDDCSGSTPAIADFVNHWARLFWTWFAAPI